MQQVQQLQYFLLLHVQRMLCKTCLDFLPVLEVDPSWHITNELDKTLLARCNVELHEVSHMSADLHTSGRNAMDIVQERGV